MLCDCIACLAWCVWCGYLIVSVCLWDCRLFVVVVIIVLWYCVLKICSVVSIKLIDLVIRWDVIVIYFGVV